jgi:type IV pilus assembly protein PilE
MTSIKLQRKNLGFSLIELMITVAIIGILASVALPSYRNYVTKASRAAAQSELLQVANLQEKIYLNSSKYTANISAAYTGQATGGLGSTGFTKDLKYVITLDAAVTSDQAFTLVATPQSGTTQEGDGNITIDQTGRRMWGTVSW